MTSSSRARLALLLLIAALPSVASAAEPSQEAEARYSQGVAYYRVGAFEEAIKEFEASFELFPRAGALFNIGRAYEELGNFERAVEYYERYVGLDSKKTEVIAEANARIVALKKKIEEKRERERQRELDVKLDLARDDLGAGKASEALVVFREVYGATNDPEIIFDIADALRALGDKAQAEIEYQRYLDSAPNGTRRDFAKTALEELRAPPPPPPELGGPAQPIQTTSELEAEEEKTRFGALADAAVDPVGPGAGLIVGGTYSINKGFELSLAAIIAGSFGVRPGGRFLFGEGSLRPSISLGLPIFFDDSVAFGIRAAPGARISIAGPVAASVEAGIEFFPNAPTGFRQFVFVPTAGLRAGF